MSPIDLIDPTNLQSPAKEYNLAKRKTELILFKNILNRCGKR